MCWVKENRWGPGAASPLGMKVGLPVSTVLNFGIGITSATNKRKEIVRTCFMCGNAALFLRSSATRLEAKHREREVSCDGRENEMKEREAQRRKTDKGFECSSLFVKTFNPLTGSFRNMCITRYSYICNSIRIILYYSSSCLYKSYLKLLFIDYRIDYRIAYRYNKFLTSILCWRFV